MSLWNRYRAADREGDGNRCKVVSAEAGEERWNNRQCGGGMLSTPRKGKHSMEYSGNKGGNVRHANCEASAQ